MPAFFVLIGDGMTAAIPTKGWSLYPMAKALAAEYP